MSQDEAGYRYGAPLGRTSAIPPNTALYQVRQRLAEVESQLAGHDALVAERDILRRMIEAAEAVR